MTEDELRALIRQAVARHLGTPAPATTSAVFSDPVTSEAARGPQPALVHPSHYQYLALVNVGEACLIEPSVHCNHCGYCKSHGH